MPKSQLRPIDNCVHKYEWDEVAEEDYCIHCGFIPEKEKGGWHEPDSDDS